MSIKVVIADDSLIFREGIKKLVKSVTEIQIVGEAKNLNEALHLCRLHKPDIIFLEINLCSSPISEFIKEVNRFSPSTKFFVITDCDCGLPVFLAIKAGVNAFLKKNVDSDEFIKAIKEVIEGRNYITPIVMQDFFKGFSSFNSNQNQLTEKEQVILRYFCLGRSSEQIADILNLSEKTIATHKRNIMQKAKVKRTSDLIFWGIERGYKN